MDVLTREYASLGGASDDSDSDGGGGDSGGGTVILSSTVGGNNSKPPQTSAGSAADISKDLESSGSDDDSNDDDNDDEDKYKILAPATSAAPPVSDALIAAKVGGAEDPMVAPVDPSKRSLTFNPKYDQLWAPLEGPAHPHTRDGRALGLRNHRLGSVHDASLDSFVFDEQYNTFQAYGYTVDPASLAGAAVVGDKEAVAANKGATVYNLAQEEQRKKKKQRREELQEKLSEQKKRDERGDGDGGAEEGGSGDEDMSEDGSGGEEVEGVGPVYQSKRKGRGKKKGGKRGEDGTSGEDEEEQEGEEEGGDVLGRGVANPASDQWLLLNTKSPWSGKLKETPAELTEEQKKYAEEHALKKEKKQRGEKVEEEEKSTFHGKEETDYQGRSWIAPPKDAKPENEHCYIPKRWIHTWSGHTKGVSAIRFFPRTGHLLLSASMDTKIKIWDVPGSKKCMRTYMGHSKAVRDISFSNDGARFLSASYDRKIKLWDTETGKVISTFSTGKIPYVVRLHPDDDKQNILLAGMSDKKIMQWDTNTGEITQEYDQHLGAVNTITFVDDNRRFVTSSDDKSLRVWEFGIPVVVKYISEPHMHSMPSISLSPNKNWVAAQSLDNQILIYGTRDRFRLNRKKRFAGHVVAGYACQVNFSPDNRFVMSGDGEGRLWFWDWKTCKVFRTLKCHDNSPCIGCEWHPLEQSKVATCGWDGLIKYWD